MQAQSVCDRAAVVRRVQLSVTQSMIHWGQWCICCYCVGLCWRTPELMRKLRVRNFYYVRETTRVCVIVSAESGWVCQKVQKKSGFFFLTGCLKVSGGHLHHDKKGQQRGTREKYCVFIKQWNTFITRVCKKKNIPQPLHYNTNCHTKLNLKMFSVSIMKIRAQSLPVPLVFENPHTPRNRGTRAVVEISPYEMGRNSKPSCFITC